MRIGKKQGRERGRWGEDEKEEKGGKDEWKIKGNGRRGKEEGEEAKYRRLKGRSKVGRRKTKEIKEREKKEWKTKGKGK